MDRIIEKLLKGYAQLGPGALDTRKQVMGKLHARPFGAIRERPYAGHGPGRPGFGQLCLALGSCL